MLYYIHCIHRIVIIVSEIQDDRFNLMTQKFTMFKARDFLKELKQDVDGGRILLPVRGGSGNSTIVGFKVLEDDAIILESETFGTMYYS